MKHLLIERLLALLVLCLLLCQFKAAVIINGIAKMNELFLFWILFTRKRKTHGWRLLSSYRVWRNRPFRWISHISENFLISKLKLRRFIRISTITGLNLALIILKHNVWRQKPITSWLWIRVNLIEIFFFQIAWLLLDWNC